MNPRVPRSTLSPAFRRRAVRFCATGLLTAAVYLAVAWMFVEWAGLRPALAGAFAFLAAIPLNYLMHKLWSFESRRLHRQAMPRFLATIGTGLLINSAMIELLHTFGGLHYLIAQLLAMCCVIAWNFLAFDRWVFRI